ncbi:MAG: hypothetical protein JXA25_05365 [Anaerolineales bacterium]|nr:hypothetical protein [Anaerolineales bacterium]
MEIREKNVDRSTSLQQPGQGLKILYRIGAAAAILAAVFRRNFDAEYYVLREFGIFNSGPLAAPDTIAGWFELLQENPLIAFTLLSGFDLFNYLFVAILVLALWGNLGRTSKKWSTTAGILGFAGTVYYAATNKAFVLLSLSSQFPPANHTGQTSLLNKGKSLLAVFESNSYAGTGLYPSFLLISTALLILSVLMLHSPDFSRRTALLGILANGFGLGYYIFLMLFPGLVFVPLSISAVFLLAWYLSLAYQLLKLANNHFKKPFRTPEPVCSR